MTLTPLVGRADDIVAVKERLGFSRLVTLTGPGGIGKTRLGVAVAEELGAPVVDLTSITDGDLIAPEISTALGLQPNLAIPPMQGLAHAMGTTERLVVLDNVESLPPAGLSKILESLLAQAPALRLLATGRTPVGIPGEAEFQVRPLATPDGETAEALEASTAGALLLQRARAIGAISVIAPGEAPALAALCRRLDGIPLALELAASQLRVYSPTEIQSALDRGVDVLADPQRPQRQRSLEATITWSIDLLDAEQLLVLTVATAFAGGFELPLMSEMLPGSPVSAHVNTLVAMGLVRVVRSTDGVRRFDLLETIRSIAAARVEEGDASGHRVRHAAVIAGFVRRNGSQLDRPDSCITDRLFRDRDNIRTAFEWAIDQDVDLALELVARLGEYWFEIGALDEGIDWADRALGAAGGDGSLRLHAGATRIHLKRMRSSRGLAEEAEELWLSARSSPDPAAATRAMALASSAIQAAGVSPIDVIDEALKVAEGADLVAWVPGLLTRKARSLQDDDPLASIGLLEEADRLAHDAGDVHSEAFALGNLGAVLQESDVTRAIAYTRRAHALLGDEYPTLRAWLLSNLAGFLARSGDPGAGRSELVEAVEITIAHPGVHLVEMTFANVPIVCLHNGFEDLACRAMGYLARLDEERGVQLSAQEVHGDETDRRQLHARVGEVRAHVLEAQGRAELADPLLREVLTALQSEVTPKERKTRVRLRHGDLTRREVEVLELLANGHSDPEIGAALFISPSTASVHVSNIKSKLGVETRVEAALKARELGLAPPMN